MQPDGFMEYYNQLSTSPNFSPIDLRLRTYNLAPYKPTSPSLKPPPSPPPFGAFKSTRPLPTPTSPQKPTRKPTNSTYHLIFATTHLQHLHPSPHSKSFPYQPSYSINHHTCPNPSYYNPHDIEILRSDNDKSGGGVAVIGYIYHTPVTHITYSKTGLMQNLVSDFTRYGDDGEGIVIVPWEYFVRINREDCVWRPLGSSSSSSARASSSNNDNKNEDGTILGVMELRNVVDGKLCATVGSEWSGGKRCVMVRGEWAPGSGPFEQVMASLVAMLGRERDRVAFSRKGAGAVLP